MQKSTQYKYYTMIMKEPKNLDFLQLLASHAAKTKWVFDYNTNSLKLSV